MQHIEPELQRLADVAERKSIHDVERAIIRAATDGEFSVFVRDQVRQSNPYLFVWKDKRESQGFRCEIHTSKTPGRVTVSVHWNTHALASSRLQQMAARVSVINFEETLDRKLREVAADGQYSLRMALPDLPSASQQCVQYARSLVTEVVYVHKSVIELRWRTTPSAVAPDACPLDSAEAGEPWV